MEQEEYESMITDVLEGLTVAASNAAERNAHKDLRRYGYRLPDGKDPLYHFVKGWSDFDLREKLLEEFKEVVANPTSINELGDLAWVCAMMIDQISSKRG